MELCYGRAVGVYSQPLRLFSSLRSFPHARRRCSSNRCRAIRRIWVHEPKTVSKESESVDSGQIVLQLYEPVVVGTGDELKS